MLVGGGAGTHLSVVPMIHKKCKCQHTSIGFRFIFSLIVNSLRPCQQSSIVSEASFADLCCQNQRSWQPIFQTQLQQVHQSPERCCLHKQVIHSPESRRTGRKPLQLVLQDHNSLCVDLRIAYELLGFCTTRKEISFMIKMDNERHLFFVEHSF